MIRIYLVLTFALSSIFYALIISAGTIKTVGGLYVLGLMWCPGVAAMITCFIAKRKLSTLGWRWPKTRYVLAAYLIPIAYALPIYVVTWLTGLGRFPETKGLEPLIKGLPQMPISTIIAVYVAIAATLGLISATIAALGEEIGWRGFLVPEMAARFPPAQTAVLIGLIWAAWHTPVLLFADYNSGTPWWYGLPCFTLMVISVSLVLTWLRLKSGSLWPAAVLHASHNLWIQGIFDKLTGNTGKTAWITGEFGIALVITLGITAAIVWKKAPLSSDIPAMSEQIPPQPETAP